MQFDRPMPRGGEQRLGEPLLPIGLQQGTRQPKRFEPEQEMPCFAQIAGPEQIFHRRAGAVVDEDRVSRPEISRIPETPSATWFSYATRSMKDLTR